MPWRPSLPHADVLVAPERADPRRQARGHPGRPDGGDGERPAGRGEPAVGHPGARRPTASAVCSCRPATTTRSPTRSQRLAREPALRATPRRGRTRDGAARVRRRPQRGDPRRPDPPIARRTRRERLRRSSAPSRTSSQRIRRMSALLFWLASGLVGYTYVGFPLLVLLRARLAAAAAHDRRHHAVGQRRHRRARRGSARSAPASTTCSRSTTRADRLEIVIASDGSTDADGRRGGRRDDPRVRVLDLPRTGKATRAQRRRRRLDRRDPRLLGRQHGLRPGRDPPAGPLLRRPRGRRRGRQPGLPARRRRAWAARPERRRPPIGAGERSYWDFDRVVKDAESLGGSVISATGRDLRDPPRAVPRGPRRRHRRLHRPRPG